MKINGIKRLITFTLLCCIFFSVIVNASDEEILELGTEEISDSYYALDDVYSTYSQSTNYTIEGAMYTSENGIAVRSKTTNKVTGGLILPVELNTVVTEESALVLDVMFYSNLTRTMKVELVMSDDSIRVMENTRNAYTAKNNDVVSTLVIGNNAYNNNLNASSGYATKEISTAYNQLVVPLTSFGLAVDDSVSIKGINFYTPNWSTSTYNKYVFMGIQFSKDFTAEVPFTTESIWEAQPTNYTLYGTAEENLDIRYLRAGQVLIDPSINGSGNAVAQDLVFKFPDALINGAGMVETKNLAGMTLDFVNETATAFNGHFKLYSTDGQAIANSNYSNLKTHKITSNGTEALSNAKYFYSNTNTVGYADASILYKFVTTPQVTSDSTESFFSTLETLPEQISPYFTFTYDNNITLEVDEVFFGTIRILTSDTSVYQNTTSHSSHVSVSKPKGFIGDEVTFKAIEDPEIAVITLNGETLTNEQLEALFSETGLTVNMTGHMELNLVMQYEIPYSITVEPSTDGVLLVSNDAVLTGHKVRVVAKPKAGYVLDKLFANNVNVTAEVENNSYIMTVGEEAVNFSAQYKKAETYFLEQGATSSLYNSYPGVIWAEFDAINVQSTVGFAQDDPAQNIGVILEDINHTVSANEYLVIELQNMINLWRTFEVRVNGVANNAEGTYYMQNRYHEVLAKTGTGIIVESSPSANRSNETLTVTKTEGFFGKVIIPLESFTDITSIDEISVYTSVKDKSYARFNVGNIYVTSNFDAEAGVILTEEDSIWTPSAQNWSSFDAVNAYSAVKFLEKGDISLQTVVANSYGYDSLYVSLPQNMINENGYVDLQALGIKGIAIDVNNYNLNQHSMAIRIAGSDNVSLTDTTKTLWQTSISNHPASIVYPSGLVKTRSSAFIPYDEQGVFEGTIYIPFNSIAFTNIGAQGAFPTLIQPVLRILPGSMNNVDYSSYDFEIGNIRFITDETEFSTFQIFMSQLGGELSGDIQGVPVTNSSNNNVLSDTEVKFTITSDNGYEVKTVTYVMGNNEEVTVELDENNSFVINVTGELLIQAICEEIQYEITYNLQGGTNHEDNPEFFTIDSSKIILEAPEKEGYKFLGWYSNDSLVTEVPAGSKGNISLEARWELLSENTNVDSDSQGLPSVVKIIIPSSLVIIGVGLAFYFVKKKKL